jgi:hypothetical protein
VPTLTDVVEPPAASALGERRDSVVDAIEQNTPPASSNDGLVALVVQQVLQQLDERIRLAVQHHLQVQQVLLAQTLRDELRPLIEPMVAAAVAAIPPPAQTTGS